MYELARRQRTRAPGVGAAIVRNDRSTSYTATSGQLGDGQQHNGILVRLEGVS